MNILKDFKWLIGGVTIFIVYSAILIAVSYDKGEKKVYQDIANAPVVTTIRTIHDTIPAPYPVIKRLKADTVFQTPDEIIDYISSLSDSVDILKKLLIEKSRPYQTFIDSARFSLSVLSHPWERINDIDLRLKAIPYDYSEITNNRNVIKDIPLWQHIVEIGGGCLVGYEVSRLTK
jgi:hypothetical protein